jgi:hypothetical protein
MKKIHIRLPDGDKHEIAINPQFEKQLPDLIQQLNTSWVEVNQPLSDAEEALTSLQDFVAFEIAKAELSLSAAKDDENKDAEFAYDTWLRRLKGLQAAFPAPEAQASAQFLDGALREFERILELKEEDEENLIEAMHRWDEANQTYRTKDEFDEMAQHWDDTAYEDSTATRSRV